MQTAKANSKSKKGGKSAVRTPAVPEAVAVQAQDPVAAETPDMKPAEPQATDIGAVNPVEIGRASCRERVYVLV